MRNLYIFLYTKYLFAEVFNLITNLVYEHRLSSLASEYLIESKSLHCADCCEWNMITNLFNYTSLTFIFNAKLPVNEWQAVYVIFF